MFWSPLIMLILAITLYNVFKHVHCAGLVNPLSSERVVQPENSENLLNIGDFSNNFQHKFETLIQTVSRMDKSIQNFQEKSQHWAIFQHHIESLNDGMRILENKLDLLKRTHEEQHQMLGKVEFMLDHINPKDTSAIDEIKQSLKRDRDVQIESLTKLNVIWRHLQGMQSEKTAGKKNANVMAPIGVGWSSCNLTKLDQRFNTVIHQMALQKDLKQLHSLEKRSAKSLEGLTESVAHALDKQEEITTRLQKSNECCYSLSSELTTFTESSDILLKRIEKLVRNVSEKINQIDREHEDDNEMEQAHNTVEDDNVNVHTNGIFSDDIESNEEKEEIDENKYELDGENDSVEQNLNEIDEHIQEIEFLRPDLNGCHQLLLEKIDKEDIANSHIDGIYKFLTPEINNSERDFNERFCIYPNANDTGLPWTVIQQRGPYKEQENFNRSWTEYRNGFGQLYREFWFGNEFIHRLVFHEDYELRIELEDFNGTKVWAEYQTFRLDAEAYNYNLLIGDYRGTVSDAMKYHNDNDFSTYDKRNDRTVDGCCSCSAGYGSGWWFDNCSEANLNGIYHETPLGHNYVGIMWELWHGDYSLKSTRMMMRPKNAIGKHNTYVSYNDDVHSEDP